jgi:5-(carboxyamino)imidazole ribonucleotide synthase
MKTIGILGGGQLGGMLSESLLKFGARVSFYDPDPTSPSFFRSPIHFQGEWNDFEKLKEFFSKCDAITYEFENVSTELLDSLVQMTGTKIYPSAKVLSITQNRILEKTFLKENNIPVCNFVSVKSYESIKVIAETFSFPYIIKTATGGYDGKGQWNISNKKDFELFLNEFPEDKFVELIFEEKISIECEASCIVARNTEGESICFPIFDNIHKNHILYNTTMPSQIPNFVQDKLKEIALEAAKKLNVIGLLTTEFFITKQKSHNDTQKAIDSYFIYVNEFAPRPHNSGHITRNSCNISQFDAHARVLLNLPLHEPKLHPGFYCMGNLLGDSWISQGNKNELNLDSWKEHPEIIDIILYGKLEAKANRKMGHFVSFSEKNGQHITAAERFREDLNEK